MITTDELVSGIRKALAENRLIAQHPDTRLTMLNDQGFCCAMGACFEGGYPPSLDQAVHDTQQPQLARITATLHDA